MNLMSIDLRHSSCLQHPWTRIAEWRKDTAEVLPEEHANKVCRSSTHDPCRRTAIHFFFEADPVAQPTPCTWASHPDTNTPLLSWHLTEYI